MSETTTTTSQMLVWQRHQGVWEGTYTRFDARTGEILDKHQSRLSCRCEGDLWQQRNEYTWDDGRTQTLGFDGVFTPDGWLHFDTPKMCGDCIAVDANSIFFSWIYKDEPGHSYSELITLVSDTHRSRVWQHFENGAFAKLTVIDEHKVSSTPQF